MTDEEVDKLKARIAMLEAKNLALVENNRHLQIMFSESSQLVVDAQKEGEVWRDVAYSRLFPRNSRGPKPKMSWEDGYDREVDMPLSARRKRVHKKVRGK